jgi:hypothetical protein
MMNSIDAHNRSIGAGRTQGPYTTEAPSAKVMIKLPPMLHPSGCSRAFGKGDGT